MGNNFLLALEKLYKELGFTEPDIIKDIQNYYLTEQDGRSGRVILAYVDNVKNVAIYCDTCEFLTEEEKEEEIY